MAPLPAATYNALAEHFSRITPLLLTAFAPIPLAFTTYPDGLEKPPLYVRRLDGAPAGMPVIDVATSTGRHQYPKLDEICVRQLVEEDQAVELFSWTPSFADSTRASYARILLTPHGLVSNDDFSAATFAVRDRLAAAGLNSIPVHDGGRGVMLWIPLHNAPVFADVIAWLHDFVTRLTADYPVLLTQAHLKNERGDRVYLGILSNHPGLLAVLPYSPRGGDGLPLALPFAWSDWPAAAATRVTLAEFPAWLARNGDRFNDLKNAIGPQDLPPVEMPRTISALAAAAELSGLLLPDESGSFAEAATPAGSANARAAHGVIDAAVQLLADGVARTAQELLMLGQAQGVFDQAMTQKHLYNDLYEYITRSGGTGKTAELTQDPLTHAFRINRPLDPWPVITLPPLPAWLDTAAIEDLCKRLKTTATGNDPAAFEIAVCDAFAALGFSATHMGGDHQPDGILNAPLGEAGYRCIVECKTARPGDVVNTPRAEEPALFRDAYNAQFALLIGPAFENGAVLQSELQTHRVALWTVDDLARVLRAQCGPWELKNALAPGNASTALDALLWERDHGARKRSAVIEQALLELAWRTQGLFAASAGVIGGTPVLTADALYLLADTALVRGGVAGGTTRAEFAEALQSLCLRGDVQTTAAGGYFATHPPAGPALFAE